MFRTFNNPLKLNRIQQKKRGTPRENGGSNASAKHDHDAQEKLYGHC